MDNNGWRVPLLQYKASGFWISALLAKLDFDKYIRYFVSNGKKISFWNDIWCGDTFLRTQFWSLFMVDRVQNAFIFDYIQILGERVVWVFSFC